ncbi:hypothetical protein LCGC14_1151710 [marine sediment metagenome]|uniref:Scaffolding protein n=1 Tax=marine sediment metagenome TaxID=412755 RepID=A0A0F9LV89_9ZZZZ
MRYGRSVYGRHGVLSSQLSPELLALFLVGAEGQGDDGDGGKGGDGSSGDGSSGSSGAGSDGGDGSGDGGSGDGGKGEEGDKGKGGEGDAGKTYDQAYVEKLRKEAADRRVKLNEVEKELAERKKADMTDLEKAQTEREEEKTRADIAETALGKSLMESAVTTAASDAKFHNARDAISLLGSDEIATNEDGSPNEQSVKAAVKRLGEASPHLVKGKDAGSGDGSARGDGAGKVLDKQKEYKKQFQQQGGVPMPDIK